VAMWLYGYLPGYIDIQIISPTYLDIDMRARISVDIDIRRSDRDDLPVMNAYPLGAAHSLIAVSRASRELYVPSGGSTSSENAVCAITATLENYGCG
jgi:hypothetical protein